MENKDQRYLGDGVYVTFDGEMICLDLRGQDDFTRIYMEPEVINSFMAFLQDMKLIKEERQ